MSHYILLLIQADPFWETYILKEKFLEKSFFIMGENHGKVKYLKMNKKRGFFLSFS